MSDNASRFAAPDPATVGLVRTGAGLPHTYEVNALGGTYSRPLPARWNRGDVVRSGTVAVSLTSATPMYDRSDPIQRQHGPGGSTW